MESEFSTFMIGEIENELENTYACLSMAWMSSNNETNVGGNLVTLPLILYKCTWFLKSFIISDKKGQKNIYFQELHDF